MTTQRANLDVVILTLNEELNLPHALRSVADWTHRVFVVDAGSTDDTCRVAESFGAHVVHHPWQGYARQKNWALDNLPLEADWVLLLDADEAVLDDLRRQIETLTARPVEQVEEAAFYVNQYFVFLGKRIRHCGYYPSWHIRLLKRGGGRFEDRDVHERLIVDGSTGYLPGHLEHWGRRGVAHWMAKHNQYAQLEAMQIFRSARGARDGELEPRLLGDWEQRRRWIKRYVFPRLPARWLMRFLYMYVYRLGFLDGLTGLRFCLFVAAYDLMIALNLVELRRGLAPFATSTKRAADTLSAGTGEDGGVEDQTVGQAQAPSPDASARDITAGQ